MKPLMSLNSTPMQMAKRMSSPSKRASSDSLDLRLNPTDELMAQIDLNREFVEHMLATPEGEAEDKPKEGNTDD